MTAYTRDTFGRMHADRKLHLNVTVAQLAVIDRLAEKRERKQEVQELSSSTIAVVRKY